MKGQIRMKDKETPLKLVRLWPKMMPGCYDTLDNLKGVKAEGRETWPDYCELPLNAAFTYLVGTGLEEVEATAGAAELTACYLWRKNKIIYSFDPDLAATLADQAKETEETDVLPSELLCILHTQSYTSKLPDFRSNTMGSSIGRIMMSAIRQLSYGSNG